MGWSAWQQRNAMQYTQQIREAILQQSYKDYPLEWLTDDIKRGGDRLREAALLYQRLLVQTMHVNPLDDIDRGWYELFMRAAHEAARAPHVGARMAGLDIWLRYKLLTELAAPAFITLEHETMGTLTDSILLACYRAPLRDDQAALFLHNLPEITHNNPAKQIDILQQILTIAPDHRGALWLLGHILAKTPGRETEGNAMIHRAVSLGVERVYPVTDKELAAVH
jgi:hypothetical protein